mgnify:CR=1 FL=1
MFNVNTIKSGELDLGFTQSDVQYNAVKGIGQFKDGGAVGDLRAVPPEWRDGIPEYVKDYVPLNQFM